MMVKELLEIALEAGATDIHLEGGMKPWARIGNDVAILAQSCITDAVFRELRVLCRGDERTVDASFGFKDVRIRVHLYRAADRNCATLRLLHNKKVMLGDDADSQLLARIVSLKEGFVLIAGPTGSGKSFTLAGCIQYVNENFARHIVTLEDPIEYTFVNEKSLIHQRQLGRDVTSMAEGVRQALREDPDVIMIGELRDRATLEAALHAAETGHLVFATMHTQRAVMAVNRIISLFPAEQQDEVRSQLSQVLRAVVCQRLIVCEQQFLVARDILLNTPAVANLIRQRKEPQIYSIQETQAPMRTMEMAVRELQAKWGHPDVFKEVLDQGYESI